ncbi:universal stress protein [Flavobacterium sp. H122]|uniref:universal stress protein n=1 Tax=Flavobacterium sp. H122 TaxID=2529860 RepID=UPI0010AACF63|nr:universal stress protein [Flavobacterium sp. H122]
MKTILVPTDFSEVANNAALFALQLAQKNNARVILFHTYNLPVIDGQAANLNVNALYDTLELSEFEHFKINNEKLRNLAQERNLEHVELFHKLTMGELVSSINECVEEENADFVVIGTTGGDDWFSKIFGSNTDSVIQSVKVPTLIIPEGFEDTELNTVGFTTRFREKDKESLRNTIGFAQKIKAKVKCLYVQTDESDVDKGVIEAWQNEFKSNHVEFIVYPSNDVFEAIDYFIVHHEIDILGMVTYKRNFFVDLFTRRFTQKVSHKVDIPVLVFHE